MQFRPYIFIQTSDKRPSSIAVAGWTGNQMKYKDLPPSFESESLPQVQDIVREHFRANDGQCHLYGLVVGYRFVVSETESIVLDTSANVLRRENGTFWPKSISMENDVRPVEV